MTAQTVLDEARERLRPYVERAIGFSGWMDFPANRQLGPDYPWDYMQRAMSLLRDAGSVLDMGTGGGERFAELLAGYDGTAVATEEWHVNAPIAQRNLGKIGFQVVRAKSLELPFKAGCFDLVLDRHEELEPVEVGRVLIHGGRVLTQQVWRNWTEIPLYFPRATQFGDHFHAYQRGLIEAGMQLTDAREHTQRVAYPSLGDFVYVLCVCEWEVPGFDPLGGDLEALLRMERELVTADGFVVTEGRYIIEAVKPRA